MKKREKALSMSLKDLEIKKLKEETTTKQLYQKNPNFW
jgi:hypothetical protein